MKQILAALLVAVFLAGAMSTGTAEGGWILFPSSGEPSPEDVPLNEAVTIAGYCSLTWTDFSFQDRLGYYRQGSQTVGGSNDYHDSGEETEYAIVYAEVENIGTAAVDYLADAKVTVADGKNLYGGWVMQRRPENAPAADAGFGEDSGRQNLNWVIHASDQFPIAPSGVGYYVFGCTLPNAVADGTDPLTMTITIGGNDFVCRVRLADASEQGAAPASTELPAPTAMEEPPQPTEAPAADRHVVANTGDTHVRSGPGLNYTSLGVLYRGQGAPYLNQSSTDGRGVAWYKITYDGEDGWVSSRYTRLVSGSWSGNGGGNGSGGASDTSYVRATEGKSYVRSGPGKGYPQMGVLKKGASAPYLNEKSTDNRGVVWYKIRFEGEACWVSSRYTTLY